MFSPEHSYQQFKYAMYFELGGSVAPLGAFQEYCGPSVEPEPTARFAELKEEEKQQANS